MIRLAAANKLFAEEASFFFIVSVQQTFFPSVCISVLDCKKNVNSTNTLDYSTNCYIKLTLKECNYEDIRD